MQLPRRATNPLNTSIKPKRGSHAATVCMVGLRTPSHRITRIIHFLCIRSFVAVDSLAKLKLIVPSYFERVTSIGKVTLLVFSSSVSRGIH